MKTAYGLEARLLICDHCSAPFEAGIEAGLVRCSYCGTSTQLAARGANSTLAGAVSQMSEPERYQKLREQDGKPLMPPPALMKYLAKGGLNPAFADQADAEWRQLHTQLQQGGAYGTEERLYFLTLLLTSHHRNDDRRVRAYVESALEVVKTPRHEQVFRCTLARSAARLGDIESAAGWLKGCNPQADDIHMDTAYRMSAAVLCTARQDWAGVLRQLGNDIDDVPIADGSDEFAALVRANAHEKSGRGPTAVDQLRRIMQGKPKELFEKIRATNQQLDLCPQSFATVAAEFPAAPAGGVAKRKKNPIGLIFLLLPIGFFIAAFMAPEGATTDDGYPLNWFFVFMGACFLIGPLLMLVLGFLGARKAKYMAEHGIDAMGQIVGAEPTGVRINDQPQMALQIQVHHPEKGTYSVTHKKVLSVLDIAQLGQMIGGTVQLKIDPKNPQNVMMV